MRGVVDLLNSPAVRPDQVTAFLENVDAFNIDDRPTLEQGGGAEHVRAGETRGGGRGRKVSDSLKSLSKVSFGTSGRKHPSLDIQNGPQSGRA
jgi:hypothetical protein